MKNKICNLFVLNDKNFGKQKKGHIVNIISTVTANSVLTKPGEILVILMDPAGVKIVPMQGVYAATKNAVRTISETFRQESDGCN